MNLRDIDLKKTVNLPRTDFPMKANLPTTEPKTLAHWQDSDLYGKIRQARAGRPRYVLHDGPPYANGNIHLGHVLNKCLKDFVIKSKTMSGFDSPYIPGWDCHGLPIEIKVDNELGSKKAHMSTAEIRRACRKYATKYVDLQRKDFMRLGILGRWNDPYLTMSPQYQGRDRGAPSSTSSIRATSTKASSRSTGASTIAPPLAPIARGGIRESFEAPPSGCDSNTQGDPHERSTPRSATGRSTR